MSNSSAAALLLTLAATVLSSCEKVIEPGDLPGQEPLIVVNSVFVSDDISHAEISSSKSIVSGKAYKLIDNARCEVYENGEFREILTSTGQGNYQGTLTAKPNHSYLIRVSAPGYTTAEASTVLPPEPNVKLITHIDTAGYVLYNMFNGTSLRLYGSERFSVTIADNPAENNFYSITPLVFAFDKNGEQIDSIKAVINTLNTSGFATNVEYIGGNTLGFDDSYIVNGNEIVLGVEVGANDIRPYGISARAVDSLQILLVVSNMSESLYRYRKSANLQASTGPNVFSEPVIVYTNVKNGVGIFGGVSGTTCAVFTGTVGTR